MGVTILPSCIIKVCRSKVPAQVYLVRHEDLDVQFVGHPVLPDVELLELNEKVVWKGLQTHRLVRNRLGLGRGRVEIVHNLSLTEFAVNKEVTPFKLVSMVSKSALMVPHLVTCNSLALNSNGRSSGSNPKAFITISVLISNCEPFLITGFLRPDSSGSPNSI